MIFAPSPSSSISLAPPVKAELELGTKLVAEATGPDPWERYCLLILCTNEFLYVE